MRISTQLMHDLSINAIRRQQSDLMKLQQQMSTGRRVLTPSDDPVAASRAVSVSQAKAASEQFARNQGAAADTLRLTESVLGNVSSLLADVKVGAVNAGNAALSDADRLALAQDLRSRFQQLLGLANSQDGSGNYLFSGYREQIEPFAPTSTGIAYNGDTGGREIQVSASRTVPVALSGADLFVNIKNGNGVFATSAASANTGSGVINAGRVTNASAWTGHDYQIVFGAGGTTYDIVDATTSTTVSSGNAYSAGSAISFAGIQVEVKGAPANGDVFSVSASRNQDVFKTIDDLVKVLETPAGTDAARAQLQTKLGRALIDIDQAAEKVLTARTQVGAWELDDLAALTETQTAQHETELADLQGLDYAKAISDFTQQTTALEAAQKTYAQVSGMSLFNFIR